MAVSIRLARQGSKKRPFYRIVAAEKSFPRDGRFIEQLGFYDPRRKVLTIDRERYQHWVGVGAQASDTVHTLVRKYKASPGAKAETAETKSA
jgi:small subunit ribosomal protein S16